MLWIRLMLRECVGPEQISELRFLAPVVTTDAANEGSISGSVGVLNPGRENLGTPSGRLVLSELRSRNACLQFCQINRIPALLRRGWNLCSTCRRFDDTSRIISLRCLTLSVAPSPSSTLRLRGTGSRRSAGRGSSCRSPADVE